LRTTLNMELNSLDPHQLRQAHQMLESGATIGKIVLGGFE